MADFNLIKINSLHIPITLAVVVSGGALIVFRIQEVKIILGDFLIKPLSGIYSWAERFWISNNLSNKLEIYSRKLSVPGMKKLNKKVQVTFVEQYAKEALPEDEKIIVFSSSKTAHEKNLAKATLLFIEKNVIPRHKQTLTPELERGVKLTFARKIFVDNRESSALDYLMQHVFPEEYSQLPSLEKVVKELVTIDDFGLFTRILLHQYFRLNANLVATVDFTTLKDEARAFKDFIHRIISRAERKRVPLRFDGKYIRARIILTGKKRNLDDSDGNSYFHLIAEEKKSETIYLIAPALQAAPVASKTTDRSLVVIEKVAGRVEKETNFKIVDRATYLIAGNFKVKIITFLRAGCN